MCKRSNALSRPVLMVRGLDGYFDLSSLVGELRLAGGRPCSAVFKLRRGAWALTTFGGDSEGATPLPIPNRAVKPLSADGTWASRPWESRSPPFLSKGRPAGRPFFVLAHPYTDARMTFAPIAMSTLAIVLIALAAVVALLLRARLPRRSCSRPQPGRFLGEGRARGRCRARTGAPPPTAAGTASRWKPPRGSRSRSTAPGWRYRDLHLVLVDDRPGIEEDRAQFVAIGDDGDEAAVVLSRQGDHWSAERVD